MPTAFSSKTEAAISSGIVAKKCRIEIIQAISTTMLVHTKEPTGEQYNTVCEKLIDTFPKLRDDLGNGYVSDDISLPSCSFIKFLIMVILTACVCR